MEDRSDDENESQQLKESLPKWMRYLPSGKYVIGARKTHIADTNEAAKSSGKKRCRQFDLVGAMSVDAGETKLSSSVKHPAASNMSQVDGIHILFGEENRHDDSYVSKKARKDIEEVSSLEVAKLLEFCDFNK